GRLLRIQRGGCQLRNPPSVAVSQMPYVPWFRRKDYKHIRSIMDDADEFPETFDEWETTAKRRLATPASAAFSFGALKVARYCPRLRMIVTRRLAASRRGIFLPPLAFYAPSLAHDVKLIPVPA